MSFALLRECAGWQAGCSVQPFGYGGTPAIAPATAIGVAPPDGAGRQDEGECAEAALAQVVHGGKATKLDKLLRVLRLYVEADEVGVTQVQTVIRHLPQVQASEKVQSNVIYNGTELARRLLLVWLKHHTPLASGGAAPDARRALRCCYNVIGELNNISRSPVFNALTKTAAWKRKHGLQVRLACGAAIACDGELDGACDELRPLLKLRAVPYFSKCYAKLDDSLNAQASSSFQRLFYATLGEFKGEDAASGEEGGGQRLFLLKVDPPDNERGRYAAVVRPADMAMSGQQQSIKHILSTSWVGKGDEDGLLATLTDLAKLEIREWPYQYNVIKHLCELIKRLLLLALLRRQRGESTLSAAQLTDRGKVLCALFTTTSKNVLPITFERKVSGSTVNRLKMAACSAAFYRLAMECDALLPQEGMGHGCLKRLVPVVCKRVSDNAQAFDGFTGALADSVRTTLRQMGALPTSAVASQYAIPGATALPGLSAASSALGGGEGVSQREVAAVALASPGELVDAPHVSPPQQGEGSGVPTGWDPGSACLIIDAFLDS